MPETLQGSSTSSQTAASLSYEAYVKLVNRAIEALGSETTANHWLNTPQPRFDNQVPLEMAQREGFSLTLFEEYFSRIEHGIYS
jgi:uncharacterized protein (DUF2384 family)